ncbi:MAG: endonuclease MutS2 [Lachnospiraceae bacterium]|nr:endonuclease MutS2 [Lachnospiraceae bacterium]
MNSKVITTLEFDKIIESTVEFAASESAKSMVRALSPLSDPEEIERLQDETAAAYARIMRKGSLSFSGISGIGDCLARLSIGASLSAGELRRVASLLTVCARVKKYGTEEIGGSEEEEESNDSGDCLSERFELLEPLEDISGEINRCIISDTEIADDASHSLKTIRREIKQKKASISDRINSIMRAYAEDDKLQEDLITQRNGRYCVPVKAENKSKVPGMIHDRSQSGSTFFIEPIEIVNLNNEITELEIREKEEIERILMMLSASLVPEIENLKYDITTLTELDAIFARGMLAKKMRAVRPSFSQERHVTIFKARHPLIKDSDVVPIDLALGKDYGMLIITGPNTGGKTVSLKTMGLLHLMGLSGLHVPAREGTVLGLFDEIYADIGDEQSIEQSLSTFSSHMTRTINILEHATPESLVLFDELGAGTDPVEGAAIAMAILDRLNSQGVSVMATTHYSELKAYALTTPGVTNASCEFDVTTLKPTYRLLTGVPGKSNAFAISARLGMDEGILAEARALIGEKDRSFDDMLFKLEELRASAEEAEKAASAARNEAEKLRNALEAEKQKLKERKEKEIEEAKSEAAEVLRAAKEFADETIRKLNKQAAGGGNMREMEEERRALRKRMEEASAGVKKEQTRKVNNAPEDFRIGDSVLIISQNVKGTIHRLPDRKGVCTVTVGIMQFNVKIDDLEILKDDIKLPEKVTKNGSGQIRMSKSFTISPEINLVGKYPDEAIPLLEKYLDDAYLAGIPQVTVIHGRGTGALRNAVWEHLKRSAIAKKFRAGEFGEGDKGVTIVEFK